MGKVRKPRKGTRIPASDEAIAVLATPTSAEMLAAQSATNTAGLGDHLKFKLVARNGQHFFTNVRVSGPKVSAEQQRALLSLLNDGSLEDLSEARVYSALGETTMAAELLALTSELRAVLCS